MRFNHLYVMYSWVVLMVLSGCSIQNPEVKKVGDFKFKGLKDKSLEFSIDIELNNPNNFGFKIKKTNIDIYSTSDELLGKVTLDKSVRIKKGVTDTYQLDLTAKLADGALLKIVRMNAKSATEVHLKGKVTGTVFGIPKSKEIDQNSPLDMGLLRKIKLF